MNRAQERNASADGRFHQKADMMFLCQVLELHQMMGKHFLIGGYDIAARFQSGLNIRKGRFIPAHAFDDSINFRIIQNVFIVRCESWIILFR